MKRILVILILLMLTLWPAITLFHKDELGRWTYNRCAMASPDEHSYLLMAQNLAGNGRGGGIGVSIKTDTNSESFYPIGFPLILAAWAQVGGGSIESMHACVTALLCATVPLVFLLLRKLLAVGIGQRESNPTRTIIALIMTSLYVSNWYVLETGLFIFSEPAFMVVTFLWLLLVLRYPRWYESWKLCGWVALLAIVAWSIRGAGLVCVATTLLFPLLNWWGQRFKKNLYLLFRQQVLGWGLMLLLVMGYLGITHFVLPQAEQGYAQQLFNGLTDGGGFPKKVQLFGWSPGLVWEWGRHIVGMVLSHVQDWMANFVPPYRDMEVTLFGLSRPVLFETVAILAFFLAALGWLGRLFTPQRSAKHGWIVDLYVLFYVLLYLIWPFNMTRFWVPIYPLMLFYSYAALHDAAAAIGPAPAKALSSWRPCCGLLWNGRCTKILAGIMAGLLLILFAEEIFLKLPSYQRRLNYVSDTLAQTADYLNQQALTPPAPRLVVAGGDEAKTMTWFLGKDSPLLPPWPGIPGPRGIERQILSRVQEAASHPGQKVYVISYFTHDLLDEVFANLCHLDPTIFGETYDPKTRTNSQDYPSCWKITKCYQRWNITALWVIEPPALTPQSVPATEPFESP